MSVQEAIAFARSQIGKPYVFGATGPDGWDCSGLVQAACKAGGVHIPRTTYEQIFVGNPVSQGSLEPGDLLFPDAGHVQLYVGENRVIEAPHTGAYVRETGVWGFWRARRVFDASNSGSTTVIPVSNPISAAAAALKQIEHLAAELTSAVFWRRVGVGLLGFFVILLGIVFIQRKRIASVTETVAGTAAKAAVVA